MFRKIRWTLAAVGLVILVGGGASIFWRPAHEVVYELSRSPITCGRFGCVALYRLEVGNTGREVQPEVLVRLQAKLLDTATLRPQARDFGKVDRAVQVSDADGVRTYALGPMRPEQRVELSFVLHRPDPQAFPGWDEILVAVEGAHGAVHAGSPAWTILLRIWYSLLGPL